MGAARIIDSHIHCGVLEVFSAPKRHAGPIVEGNDPESAHKSRWEALRPLQSATEERP